MRETAFHQQIPKMNVLSNYLHSKTGFRLKPVAGIISPREFLNCLAFKVFCCSQFFRHPHCEEFSPEPDIFHEYLGHIPAFADPATAVWISLLRELLNKLVYYLWEHLIRTFKYWEKLTSTFFNLVYADSQMEWKFMEQASVLAYPIWK